MKLRNKLLPLATCLSIGAALAPMSLTSCAEVEEVLVDLKNGFNPTVGKLDPTGETSMTVDKALKLYTNAVIANPTIFYEDAYWSTAKALRAVQDNPTSAVDSSRGISHIKTINTQMDLVQEKIEDVKFGHTSITVASKTTSVPTISFKLKRKQQFTYNQTSGTEAPIVNTSVTGYTYYTMEIENVPFLFGNLPFDTATKYYNYDAALGREYYTNSEVFGYVPSDWSLRLDVIEYVKAGEQVDPALKLMSDNWTIKYSMHTEDTKTVTVGGITTTDKSTYDSNAKFENDYSKFASSDGSNYVGAWRTKSHYLSGFGIKEGE